MADVNDMTLLREYERLGSEESFALLVKRHVNLVYSVALRRVEIAAQAEEITQVVFIMLARKARSLRPDTILEGWLHETARLTALDFLRRERRRQHREQEAFMESSLHSQRDDRTWDQLAPLLDEAIGRLGTKDRNAIVLRYFKGSSVREVAETLGINENAAQQRILRAVEKMRLYFSQRGVAIPAAGITAAISAHSVQAAPGALAHSVSALTVAKGVGAPASTLTFIEGASKLMTWINLKTGIMVGVAAAALVVPLVVEHQAQARFSDGETTFRQRGEQLATLRAENDHLSQVAAGLSFSRNQREDLQRLQNEVGTLRQQTGEVAKLQEETKQLRARSGLDRPKPAGLIMAEANAKKTFLRGWLHESMFFAHEHGGQYPTGFAQMGTNMPISIPASSVGGTITTDQFEIVYRGTVSALTNVATTDVLLEKTGKVWKFDRSSNANGTTAIILREKEAWDAGATSQPPHQWAKTYAFSDGHVEIHYEAENNFDDYERQHTVGPVGNLR
jgi:RNA polymerase sigma factor (sigma-70 family)